MGTTEELNTQSNTNIFNMDVNDVSTGVMKSSQKRTSYMNKCIRAQKYFFMLSADDTLFNKITNDIFLN
jgi:hypothetical protein